MAKTSKKKVAIQGFLLENNLEKKETKDGRLFIGGNLIVGVPKTDVTGTYSTAREEMSELKVEFFSLEKKKDGGENKIYKSLLSVLDFASLASTGTIEGAEKLSIDAEIKENLFVGRDGNVVETTKLSANFVNRVKASSFVPQSKVTFSGVVLGTIEEIGGDEQPTGRLIVNLGFYEEYDKSAGITKWVIDNPNAITFVQSNWEAGSNVEIVGALNRTMISRQVITEMGFGENKVDTYTSAVTDYIITSGSYPFDDSNPFYISPEEFQAAINVRKEKINTIKTNATAATSQGPSSNNAAAGFDF